MTNDIQIKILCNLILFSLRYPFMSRKKLQKFTEITHNNRILEPSKPLFQTIKWQRHNHFFHNTNPICLELACGKGEYSTGLGKIYPDKNFIWIDIKGERLRAGATTADELWLTNVGFIRTLVHDLESFFATDEIDDIWIIHPDPRPKSSDAKRRLTHPRFLQMYESVLKPGWTLRLKTDDEDLFRYSIEVLTNEWRIIDASTFDLYQSALYADHHNIITKYEKIFHEQGRNINYLVCRK